MSQEHYPTDATRRAGALRHLLRLPLRRRLLVLAFGVRTLPHRAGLQPFLHHVRAAAFRALLRHRLAPRHEFAVGVTIAPVKRPALLRTALDDLAFAAIRALHSDGFLLDVLAGRIIAAGREFAEAPGLRSEEHTSELQSLRHL